MTKLQQSDWLRGVISLIAMMEKKHQNGISRQGWGYSFSFVMYIINK